MEDLDLDELDQAVNKMMDKPRGKKSAQNEGSASRPASVTAPTFDANPVSAPVPAEPMSPPAPRSNNVPVSRPMHVPQRRRTHPGAMDIIQPVVPSKPASAPSNISGRTGMTVQPTKQVVPEPIAPAPKSAADDVSDDVLASLTMADEPQTPSAVTKPKTDAPHNKNDWPDPLDFNDFDTPSKTEAPARIPDEPKETPPSLEPATSPEVQDEPSVNTTPFVTTKVEKRPLGAYNTAPAEQPEPQKDAEPQLVPDKTASKSDMASAAMQSSHHLDAEPEHDMNDLRNMAIPQQYKTAQAAPHEEVHSMFDTKEYHAPPQPVHTTRRGGGPGLVIAVVVLIVLIIAAVVVGYLMMTGFDITKLF